MRILALETTEKIGSVAALCDPNMLSELELNPRQRSAQSLAPALQTLLERVAWKPGEVQLVAVSIGPGSFTGLRVGVTTAKTFAYATGAEILGVDTLEAIAAAAPADLQTLSVATDAQRGEVVAGAFVRDSDGWFRPDGAAKLIEVDAWLGGLPAGSVIAGPILAKIAGRVPKGVRMLEPRYWRPTAAAVARLAARDYAAGRRDDLWKLVPRYSRRSAAEEKWDRRGGGQQ